MTTLEEIDDLLPQTQCRQCGCDGCLAYARAILEEGAAINRCAPGGAEGIARLAAATGRPVVPLDPEYGREVPFAVARIRARDCIGCAWCIRVCPTDASAGSPKHLHGLRALPASLSHGRDRHGRKRKDVDAGGCAQGERAPSECRSPPRAPRGRGPRPTRRTPKACG